MSEIAATAPGVGGVGGVGVGGVGGGGSSSAPSGNRSFVAALAVALAVRTVWIVIATRTPSGAFNDAAQYLRMAVDFSRGRLPTLVNGRPSAMYAPGYPMLLVPVILVDRLFGLSVAMSAAIVNVVAGTVTVAGTAFLARRWVSPRARNPAAWLMALAPGHIFFTPTAHAETVFAALILIGVLWVTRVVDRYVANDRPVTRNGAPDARDRRDLPAAGLTVFGLYVAFCSTVRGPGLVLIAAPAMTLVATGCARRMVLRSTGFVLVGVIAGLLPWTIINGLHAHVWSPLSTQNATVVCVGHHPLADGGFPLTDMPRQMAVDCYRYSVFDDETLQLAPEWWSYARPDEARWYRESSLRGVRWAMTDPISEIWLTKQKMVKAWTSEWDALPAGRNYTNFRWTGRATGLLNGSANGWLGLVEILAVLGLVLSRSCRRAVPVWGSALLLTMALIVGLALPHYRHGAIPFLVILASGAIVALRSAAENRVTARRQSARGQSPPGFACSMAPVAGR